MHPCSLPVPELDFNLVSSLMRVFVNVALLLCSAEGQMMLVVSGRRAFILFKKKRFWKLSKSNLNACQAVIKKITITQP